MRKRKANRKIAGLILTFLIGIFLMVLSMTIVYMLPENRMKQHIKQDVNQLVKEKEWPELIPGYLCTRKDNYTDSLMLNMATQERDKKDLAIRRAMRSNLPTYSPQYTQTVSLKKQLENRKDGSNASYYRYWHGYQVVLKPLLMILTYSQILYLNGAVLLFLFLLILLLMRKKGIDLKYILSFVFSILLLIPPIIVMNIQYSIIFFISCIAVLALLKEKGEKVIYIFLITGMLTSFFDLLTTPILSLGIPLLFLGLINKNMKGIVYIKNIIQNSLIWAVGYALTWASKWLIASVVLRENVFANALEKMFVRTSSKTTDGSGITFLDLIKKFSLIYGEELGKIILVFIMILFLVGCVMGIYKKNTNMVPLLFIAIMPFVWFFCLKNHSFIHLWFTFRNLELSYFAVIILFVQGVTIPKKLYN